MSAAAPRRPVLQRTPSLFAALAVFGLFSAPASSQWASVAQAPLSLATNPKPNVMFILDDSGSMDWDYMPDDLDRGRARPTP
jgi:type IV pilus assembly protein PilY1